MRFAIDLHGADGHTDPAMEKTAKNLPEWKFTERSAERTESIGEVKTTFTQRCYSWITMVEKARIHT